jgi:hypothetical protein
MLCEEGMSIVKVRSALSITKYHTGSTNENMK